MSDHEDLSQQESYEAPSESDVESPEPGKLDLSTIKPVDIPATGERIQEILRILVNFKTMNEGRSRKSYLDELLNCCCTYYGYNEFLADKILELFSAPEAIQFMEAQEQQRPLTLRTNTLRAHRRELAQALINRGVNLDPLGEWTKVGLVVYNSDIPIGATPEYLGGWYMQQSASSFTAVMALAPQENETILDLCCAPGGKTAYISALMKNTGVVIANDVNKERLKAHVANMHRMGVKNCITTNIDGRVFPKHKTDFNRVLLDAPCTGTGVISHDPSVKVKRSERDLQVCSHLQKELILSAIDCLEPAAAGKTGGYLVYSTCSVLVEENEAVVDYALRHRNVKIVETGLTFGTEGRTKHLQHRFHPSLSMSRRFYPHSHNMDGFFVCKLKKLGNMEGEKTEVIRKEKRQRSAEDEDASEDESSEDLAVHVVRNLADRKREGEKAKKEKKRKRAEEKMKQKAKKRSREDDQIFEQVEDQTAIEAQARREMKKVVKKEKARIEKKRESEPKPAPVINQFFAEDPKGDEERSEPEQKRTKKEKKDKKAKHRKQD
ncbi:putative Ribosomal RNA small subunit methyltransferase F [Blattamonas nauphoetae]|uniref:Ribosomal RNA small subunit methyltransferase F n=1 Tax=Blattamonas nauphoetae TaxID=2049346 RepID=A0ABQ9XMY6_9EUKA|nr:putative Ribosomal RNA small subunit methyltransferase F [Blattamonas nauphoetae]